MEVTTRRMNILLNSPFSMSPIRGDTADGRERTIRRKANRLSEKLLEENIFLQA